ncbi:MAG: helix-turn-helix domain-containing protein [Rhizobiales bacterium]|nr:helix-turn-helix domain-containing protein [Hyphomicrobiales bacterium]
MNTTTTSGLQIAQARKKKGWSQQKLAARIGIHQQTLNKIEKGKIKFSRHTLSLQQALGIVDGATGMSGTTVLIGNDTTTEDWAPLNCFYCAICEEPVEYGQMVLPLETKTKIPRPHRLVAFEDAYAVVVAVPVMSPAYEVGDIVYVNPTLPTEPNKDVLLRKELDGQGAMVIIAQLVQDTPAGWKVLQHSGTRKREFTVSKSQYPKCHRIIGKLNR